jgi:hypothetical protein
MRPVQVAQNACLLLRIPPGLLLSNLGIMALGGRLACGLLQLNTLS